MSQNLISCVYTTTIPNRCGNFSIDQCFSSSTVFGQNGDNFNNWFKDVIIPPESAHKIFSCNCQKSFSERDFVVDVGRMGVVSIASIVHLVFTESPLLGVSNVFLSYSPKTRQNHLLVLVNKSGKLSFRGYKDDIREQRQWFSDRRVLTTNKPLV